MLNRNDRNLLIIIHCTSVDIFFFSDIMFYFKTNFYFIIIRNSVNNRLVQDQKLIDKQKKKREKQYWECMADELINNIII